MCFLSVARKILPGISRLKGTAMYELFISMRQRAENALNQLDQVDHSKEVSFSFSTLENGPHYISFKYTTLEVVTYN